jgi:hypothetical protein
VEVVEEKDPDVQIFLVDLEVVEVHLVVVQ